MKPSIRIAIALVISLASSFAAADDADPLIEAKRHFERGEAHYKLGQYGEAIAEYEQAYQLSKLPSMLFNIAQAYRLAGRKMRALENYKKLVELAPDHELADEARERIAGLGADLDTTPDTTPEPDPPDPEPKPVPPPAPSPAVTATQTSDPGVSLSGTQILGVSTAGVGLVAVIVAGVYGTNAIEHSDALTNHTDGAWTDELLAEHEQGESDEKNALLFGGLGAAAIIAGGVLFWLGAKRDPERPAVTVGPTPSGDGASAFVTGRF